MKCIENPGVVIWSRETRENTRNKKNVVCWRERENDTEKSKKHLKKSQSVEMIWYNKNRHIWEKIFGGSLPISAPLVCSAPKDNEYAWICRSSSRNNKSETAFSDISRFGAIEKIILFKIRNFFVKTKSDNLF